MDILPSTMVGKCSNYKALSTYRTFDISSKAFLELKIKTDSMYYILANRIVKWQYIMANAIRKEFTWKIRESCFVQALSSYDWTRDV